MFGEENPWLSSGQFFPSYITQGHWCMVLFEFCITREVWGRVSGSVLNFTGLRNSRFTGNTDHLAQACDRPEVGELSPDLLTTSLGPLNRWDCQGERAIPEGGFAVIDRWNSDSVFTPCVYVSSVVHVLFSVLTLTACTCVKRVLPVWKASPALRSTTFRGLAIKAVPYELCRNRCLHQVRFFFLSNYRHLKQTTVNQAIG